MTTKATKRTSDRVSRIAASLLNEMATSERDWGRMRATDTWAWPVGKLKALAASCLAQDEHRGKRKAKRKRERKEKR